MGTMNTSKQNRGSGVGNSKYAPMPAKPIAHRVVGDLTGSTATGSPAPMPAQPAARYVLGDKPGWTANG
jgi:hypothetical protein